MSRTRAARVTAAVACIAAAWFAAPAHDAHASAGAHTTVAAAPAAVDLDVPLVRQAPERCGPAALHMVLGYWHADSTAFAQADSAYDPALRGSLVTDLAARARAAGFAARVTRASADSLIAWLAAGVPPIVLLAAGYGPITRAHYAVVRGWDPEHDTFVLHDGGAGPKRVPRASLEHRRAAHDDTVLLVTPRATP